MFRLFATIAAIMITVMTSPAAYAESYKIVVKQSATDFVTTVKKLQAEIDKRGAILIATVDHAAAARTKDLQLRPTTAVIFGNPAVGTLFMQNSQTAGLDLPLRILVWQDVDDKVQIGYWPPARIADDHRLEKVAGATDKMTAALAAITDAVAAP